MNKSEVLEKLCAMHLPSSGGGDTLDGLAELAESAGAKCRNTAGGSLIASVGEEGTAEKILIDAHYDEVILVVSEIKGSFVKVISPFGLDLRTLPASELSILGREAVKAVCFAMPPHLLDEKSRGKALSTDDIYLDTGLENETLSRLVSKGDAVCFARRFESSGGRIIANALDDRIGCLISLMLIEALCVSPVKGRRFDFVFASEEEAGLRGARTAGFGGGYKAALAFDVTFGSAPGVSDFSSKPVGSGAAIGFSPLLSRRMSEELCLLAKSKKIRHTREIMGGHTGTDCDALAVRDGGIPSALISVPIRNMHTAAETADMKDVRAAYKLALAFLSGGTI